MVLCMRDCSLSIIPVSLAPEPGTPGKGICATISKGSSQGLTSLGLNLQDPAGRFPKK